MTVIGLLGPAGSGKTTIAKYIADKHGAQVYTLAQPLKQLIQKAFDLKDEQLYGTKEQKETIDPRYNVSPRWLMRHVGTEGIRSVFGPNFWVDHTISKIRKDRPKLAIVDDVRFVNEAQGIQMGCEGVIWRIINKKLKWTPTGHASEDEWVSAPHDDILEHDGENLLDLHYKLGYLLNRWGIK